MESLFLGTNFTEYKIIVDETYLVQNSANILQKLQYAIVWWNKCIFGKLEMKL